MDELEFQRLLNLFPVIRPRDFVYDDTSSSRRLEAQSSRKEQLQKAMSGKEKDSNSQKIDEHDAFWSKLQKAAEKKVPAAEAGRFCEEFRKTYKKLVFEEMTIDAAKHFMNSINKRE